MARYVKRTLTGFRDTQGGYSDPETTDVIMSLDEYNEMLGEKRQLQRKLSQTKERAEHEVNDAYKDANRQLNKFRQEAKEEADRRVRIAQQAQREAESRADQAEADATARAEKAEADARQAVETMRSDLEKARYKNRNLERIMRERANAQRGLYPKKTNIGYMVLTSREADYLSRDAETGRTEAHRAWKTIIQSPHDATIPLNQIMDTIKEELRSQILAELGFKYWNPDNSGRYRTWNDGEREVNGLLKWTHIANYKSGYWEIELWHTKSITVPLSMRERKA